MIKTKSISQPPKKPPLVATGLQEEWHPVFGQLVAAILAPGQGMAAILSVRIPIPWGRS